MAEIPLPRGLVALVDDADLPLVQDRTWHALKRQDGRGYYAVTNISRRLGRGSVYMHRLLCPGAVRVDHENNDGLDNRRHNIRPCTQSQNLANQEKNRIGTTSRYKGVFWETRSGRWLAKIGYRGRHVYLGRHLIEEDAARAYNAAALELFGEFARLNDLGDHVEQSEPPGPKV